YVVSLYVLNDVSVCELGEEETIITKSPVFQKVLDTVKTIADYDVNVLIEGETGTGKSLLAKYIHYLSPRRNGPFVKVNCAAIPESLLEAELFGYVKGAFTGAVKDKPGKVELAEGGTLFLDEIGDMPLPLQAKILHLVQEKEFERLGDTRTRKVNLRIIASTNKNLKELIKRGEFREDLYYRLSVVKLHLPPLRERKEDIPILIKHLLEKYTRKYARRLKGFSAEAMRLLLSYHFPGNVRELENIVEHAVITCRGSLINVEDIQIEVETLQRDREEERERIKRVLEQVGGNRSLAARMLGMHRTTLWRKLRELGIG
ncbi:MAG: sigma 54-interacting transcriptional regulator, partial [Aquificaceae bacterium]